MKRILVIFAITVSLAACGNSSNSSENNNEGTAPGEDASGGTTPSITSGNTAARQGQEIPRDSVELLSDSTGNINPKDTTKK